MAVFPYVRSVYLNLWREFVFPYEVNLNRQINGLPPIEPRRDEPPAERQPEQRGEGGVVGFLNNLIEALEGDEADEDEADAMGPRAPGDAQEGGVVIELVIQEVDHENENAQGQQPAGQNPVPQQPPNNENPVAQAAEEDEESDESEEDEEDDYNIPPLVPIEEPQNPAPEVVAAPAPVIAPEAEAGAGGNEVAQDNQHEAPQAPPARRPGLGAILSGVSNAIVSALILPGVSYAMGELLRMALPKHMTAASSLSRGSTMRPGLLQQQWGRSLVGGCLYVVIKDMLRLYTKSRKVAAIGNRRVKNIDRARRRK